MSETRKIVKVFLASPGDLGEEREAVRDVVKELNDIFVKERGYHIELLGWEDTVSSFGRPQPFINQELDTCDLFIGMMWKRWGTAPDTEGKYTSGFEEEYDRACEHRKKSEKPEISLFFKNVDDLDDPGENLKRVLKFKEEITSSKTILYQTFSELRQFENLIRKCIYSFIQKVDRDERSSEPNKEVATLSSEKRSPAEEEIQPKITSPFSTEGYEFLETFVNKVREDEDKENISSVDIARFRLLSNSISKSGNNECYLGAHDINILYMAKENINFGQREIVSLTRFGLEYLQHENAPLWFWYSKLNKSDPEFFAISSWVGGNESEKIGGLTAMTYLESRVPDREKLKRSWIVESWFDEESTDDTKNAALEYLSSYGTLSDLDIITKEHERGDYSTARNALTCIIRILFRLGKPKEAAELVLEKQFDSINKNILNPALDYFTNFDSGILEAGLEHRNSHVRLKVVEILKSRNQLSDEQIVNLFKDSSASVRYEAISASLDDNKRVSEEEAKAILVKPKRSNVLALGLGGNSRDSDPEGEEYFEKFQSRVLSKLKEPELVKKAEAAFIYDDSPYFVLVEKNFTKHVEDLRNNIDNRFSTYFDKKMLLVKALGKEELYNKILGLKDYTCKELTRKAVNILCRKKRKGDLSRIRGALISDYLEITELDIEYIEKHGDWSDIELLRSAKYDSRGRATLLGSLNYKNDDIIAQVTYKIGKNAISDLLRLDFSSTVLSKILCLCSNPVVNKISKDVLQELLHNSSEIVRKAAVLAMLRAYPTNKIKQQLVDYIDSNDSRYYNVIHWLDLGASMPRKIVKNIAQKATEKLKEK